MSSISRRQQQKEEEEEEEGLQVPVRTEPRRRTTTRSRGR